MMIAAIGLTNPEAGVMATNPATQPEAAASVVGFPLWCHSMATQETVAAAAARWVTTKALAARPLAARALPALKPNHPNQRMPAPSTVIGRLWGMMALEPNSLRRPT